MVILETVAVVLTTVVTAQTIIFNCLQLRSSRKKKLEEDSKTTVLHTYNQFTKPLILSKLESLADDLDVEMTDEVRHSLKLFLLFKKNTSLSEAEVQNCTRLAIEFLYQKSKLYSNLSDEELKSVVDEQWYLNKKSVNHILENFADFHNKITSIKYND